MAAQYYLKYSFRGGGGSKRVKPTFMILCNMVFLGNSYISLSFLKLRFRWVHVIVVWFLMSLLSLAIILLRKRADCFTLIVLWLCVFYVSSSQCCGIVVFPGYTKEFSKTLKKISNSAFQLFCINLLIRNSLNSAGPLAFLVCPTTK